MVDLKKPLEGVPGLLLMAALIFFGATIGIGVALVFTWIPMSDALANFLGGVVGAGLGAALAVMGAVYVQRRDARERLNAPINRLQQTTSDLVVHAGGLLQAVELLNYADHNFDQSQLPLALRRYADVERYVSELPEGAELPRRVHLPLHTARRTIPNLLETIDKYIMASPAWGQEPLNHVEAIQSAKTVQALALDLSKLAHDL